MTQSCRAASCLGVSLDSWEQGNSHAQTLAASRNLWLALETSSWTHTLIHPWSPWCDTNPRLMHFVWVSGFTQRAEWVGCCTLSRLFWLTRGQAHGPLFAISDGSMLSRTRLVARPCNMLGWTALSLCHLRDIASNSSSWPAGFPDPNGGARMLI